MIRSRAFCFLECLSKKERNLCTFKDQATPFHRLVESVFFKLFERLFVGSPGFDKVQLIGL